MNRYCNWFVILVVPWIFASVAFAQTIHDAGSFVNDNYQAALQAYLAGDFDQAILLDSKALQINPLDKKAQALLSILVSEKDTANKTVIWIGGKPSSSENDIQNPDHQTPVTVFKERTNKPSADSKQLAELETRIQTVAFLLQRDSFSQYRELTGAQIQTTKRLDDISITLKELGLGTRFSNLLLLITMLVAGIALWKSWKKDHEMKKFMDSMESSSSHEDGSRVIKLRRM